MTERETDAEDEPTDETDTGDDATSSHAVVAATMADLDALVDLWLALASDQREEGSHLRARPNARVVRDRLAEAIVAEEVFLARSTDTAPGRDDPAERDPIGFVLVSRERGSYERDVDRGFIDALFVKPGARDGGIGSSLLDRGERRLATAGVDAVAIEAMASNVDARRLYRRHDYEPHRVELEKELPDR
ncbi:GNAT family N-acetyltransferase [Halopenitus persicus]|uniref:GNAT family N-acetyltransferase n=1 Tax=Halopenitus persicus TaxID=1048396 RepID=UPI000BBAB50B|nr:GNAT family N-acetyltransferase [Halopenitus persicus]